MQTRNPVDCARAVRHGLTAFHRRAEVIALAEDSGEIYKVTTDKQRRFSFAGVSRGEYRLFAWPGVDTIEYRNPLVLKKYNKDSTGVRVDQDGVDSAIELSPIEKKR